MQDNKPFIPVVEKVPADIYTETEPNPDTLAALGPLAPLAGTWYGKGGVDINPKAEGAGSQGLSRVL